MVLQHNKNLFKAVFIVGGIGSGKDAILKNIIEETNLTEMGLEQTHEMLICRYKFNRLKHRPLNETIINRQGIIINGSGADPKTVAMTKKLLENYGYSTMMIFVSTSNEVSKRRNIERGNKGMRMLPEDVRYSKWQEIQNNMQIYENLFQSRFMLIENNKVLSEQKHQMKSYVSNVKRFMLEPLKEVCKAWIVRDRQLKEKAIEVGTPESVAHAADHVAGQGKKVTIEVLRKKYHSPFNPRKFIPKDKNNV